MANRDGVFLVDPQAFWKLFGCLIQFKLIPIDSESPHNRHQYLFYKAKINKLSSPRDFMSRLNLNNLLLIILLFSRAMLDFDQNLSNI
jgi:hypothetical protein